MWKAQMKDKRWGSRGEHEYGGYSYSMLSGNNKIYHFNVSQTAIMKRGQYT